MTISTIAVRIGLETGLLFLWSEIKDVIIIMSFRAQTTIFMVMKNDVKIKIIRVSLSTGTSTSKRHKEWEKLNAFAIKS